MKAVFEKIIEAIIVVFKIELLLSGILLLAFIVWLWWIIRKSKKKNAELDRR